MTTYELSWWERKTQPTIIKNPWWKFWKRLDEGTVSWWSRQSILLTQEEADLVVASNRSNTNNLLEKLMGSHTEMLYGIQLSESATPNQYIKTFSGYTVEVEDGRINLLINTGGGL